MNSLILIGFLACGEDTENSEEMEELQFYTSCGDPVCGGYTGSTEGLPLCEGEMEGDSCEQEGFECDLEDMCNRVLRCSSEDIAVDCPVSKAKYKRDIQYISAERANELAIELQKMKMAEWEYRNDPIGEKTHLGFIIDDQPNSPAVHANGEQVDLYGYTSMAIIAIQQQQAQIQRLEQRIAELEEQAQRK